MHRSWMLALVVAMAVLTQTSNAQIVFGAFLPTPTPAVPAPVTATLFTNATATPVPAGVTASLAVVALASAYASTDAAVSLTYGPVPSFAHPPALAETFALPVAASQAAVDAAAAAALAAVLAPYAGEFNPVAAAAAAYGLAPGANPSSAVRLPSGVGDPVVLLVSAPCGAGVDTVTVTASAVIASTPVPNPAVLSTTVPYTCAAAETSCVALGNCTWPAGGACVASAVAPYVECACLPGRIGTDCSGAFLPTVLPGPAPPSPADMPGFLSVCAGSHVDIAVIAPSSHDPFSGDVLTVVDLITGGITYDFKFLSNDRHLIPDTPITSAVVDFDFVDPGTYAIAYIAVGSGYTTLGGTGMTVLPYAPPCVAPCTVGDPAACSGRGTCVAPGGVAAQASCVCTDHYFGAACELGCASTNITSSGGVLVDGSGPTLPARAGTVCDFGIEPPPTAPTTGYRIIFRYIDIDPNAPLLFTSPDLAEPIAVSLTTLPVPFDVPAPFTIKFKENVIKPQYGFELVYFALGCPSGSYVDLTPSLPPANGAPVCTPCPAGLYAPIPDTTACSACSPGTVAPEPGMADCTSCPIGTFQPASGAETCTACPVGTSAPSPGAETCTPCGLGTYAPNAGQGTCIRCPVTGFANATGLAACHECPRNTAAPYLAARTLAECVCLPGTYHHNASIGAACEVCPAGAQCAGGSAPPVPLPGYWASAQEPWLILRCVEDEHCPGGANDACSGTRTGFLCSKCPDGQTLSGNACVPCSAMRTAALPLAIGVGSALLAVLYRVANLNENDNLQSTLGVGTALGLYLQYLQFATLFQKFAVSWPSSTDSLLGSFAWANLDLSPFDVDCTVKLSYATMLVLRLCIPVFVAAVFAASHGLHQLYRVWVKACGPWFERKYPNVCSPAARQRAGALIRVPRLSAQARLGARVRLFIAECLCVYEPMRVRRSVNALLLFTEVFYVFVITASTELFGCFNNLSGKSVLVANPSIYCYESEWYQLLPIALVALFVYVVVLPAVYFYGAWRIQTTEEAMGDAHFAAWATYSSLVFKYKRSFRWWLFIILLRKLAISVFITSFPSEPLIQAVCSLGILIVSLVAQILNRPYRLRQHNQVDWVLSFLNIALILCGILFYVDRWSEGSSRLTEFASIGIIAGAAVYILCVIAVELHRVVIDKPVDRASTTVELFARRHIPCPSALRVVFSRLSISPKILFRYLALASDDDLLMAVHFSQSILLGHRQSKSMAKSAGLIRWSSKYKVFQGDSVSLPSLRRPASPDAPDSPAPGYDEAVHNDSWVVPATSSYLAASSSSPGLNDSWLIASAMHTIRSKRPGKPVVVFADGDGDGDTGAGTGQTSPPLPGQVVLPSTLATGVVDIADGLVTPVEPFVAPASSSSVSSSSSLGD